MKLIDKFLFFYSTLFASILLAGAILSGFALENTIVIVLFIPVVGYLVYQGITAVKTIKANSPTNKRQSKTKPNSPQDHNSITRLFHLTTPSYLVTITLFFLVISATIFKTTINFQSSNQLVSPIPTSQLSK